MQLSMQQLPPTGDTYHGLNCLSHMTYALQIKLVTLVKGDPKAPFSIATEPRCRGGPDYFPLIAPLYP